VFVYQIEAYRYWEKRLGRSDFTYGQFSERGSASAMANPRRPRVLSILALALQDGRLMIGHISAVNPRSTWNEILHAT
jgi:hypothetical protein